MSRQEINDTRLAHSRLSGECQLIEKAPAAEDRQALPARNQAGAMNGSTNRDNYVTLKQLSTINYATPLCQNTIAFSNQCDLVTVAKPKPSLPNASPSRQ